MNTVTRSACVLSLLAIAAMIGCSGSDRAADVSVKAAHLHQSQPGDEPVVRMGWQRSNVPDPSTIVAWLVYRGEYQGFPAEAPYLIEAIQAENLTDYQDTTAGAVDIDFNVSFEYLDRGDPTDGSVDVTYTRAGLQPGHTYYYRARRIVEPNTGNLPIATAGAAVSTAQATTLDVDPPNALSQPSASQGPVTYFYPPTPSLPSNGSTAVNPDHVNFRWTNSTGADEYQVRVYNTHDAQGQPVVQSPQLSFATNSGSWTLDTINGPHLLEPTTTYYWVVCARKGAEAEPTCGAESGWLKSDVRSFTTVPTPPPVP